MVRPHPSSTAEPHSPPEDIAACRASSRSGRLQIPGIVDLIRGPEHRTEHRSDRFTHAFTMAFVDRASLEGVWAASRHKPVAANVQAAFERIVVFDLALWTDRADFHFSPLSLSLIDGDDLSYGTLGSPSGGRSQCAPSVLGIVSHGPSRGGHVTIADKRMTDGRARTPETVNRVMAGCESGVMEERWRAVGCANPLAPPEMDCRRTAWRSSPCLAGYATSVAFIGRLGAGPNALRYQVAVTGTSAPESRQSDRGRSEATARWVPS